jgi:hypothetical protein
MPVNNKVFWARKLEANKLRDKSTGTAGKGWKVLRMGARAVTTQREKTTQPFTERGWGFHYGCVSDQRGAE